MPINKGVPNNYSYQNQSYCYLERMWIQIIIVFLIIQKGLGFEGFLDAFQLSLLDDIELKGQLCGVKIKIV